MCRSCFEICGVASCEVLRGRWWRPDVFFPLDARDVKVPKILICFPPPLNRLESPLFLGFIVYIFSKILFILIKFSQFLWKSVNICSTLVTWVLSRYEGKRDNVASVMEAIKMNGLLRGREGGK